MSVISVRAGHKYSAAYGRQFAAEQEMAVEECPTCGILHAIPAALRDHALEYNSKAWPNNTQWINCPLGHAWSFSGENKEQRLKRELNAAHNSRAQAAAERDQAKASAAAHKGHNTRIRKRIANGVCPCCNRTFKDVVRHMASQHPDYSIEAAP